MPFVSFPAILLEMGEEVGVSLMKISFFYI